MALSLLLSWLALATGAGPQVSEPLWLISPKGNAENRLALSAEEAAKVVVRNSNNNLAIRIHGGRLYFAFRSATHHHPKPPIWSPQYRRVDEATTRMYVLSAPWKGWNQPLAWRLEMEVNSFLREKVLEPRLRDAAKAKAWAEAVYGADEATRLGDKAARQSLFEEFDLREPYFLLLNDKLHFYFQQVEGKSMKFNSLRTWHVEMRPEGATVPEPVLSPKEHFWDIQVKDRVAHLSSYSGAHYVINNDALKNLVHLRKSTDGIRFETVDGKDFVYRGGASEAALLFVPNGLFGVLRLDDGDERGWGALIVRAPAGALGSWTVPKRADPRRFDSPRLFTQGKDIYLIARQNLCAGKTGQWDESRNCPFDRAFIGADEAAAQKSREGILDKISKKVLSLKVSNAIFDGKDVKLGDNPGISLQYEYTYHFELPKRTALYRFDPAADRFVEVMTLPSSGDTAFPSLERLSDREILVGNYSSDPSNAAWTWRDGQQNRSGIYLIKLTFPK